MTIALLADISATVEDIALDGPLDAVPGDLFRLGSEVVEFGGYQAKPGLQDPRAFVVFARGRFGTAGATHTAGTELLGVVVALVSGADQAFPAPFAGGSLFVQATDPGAIGARRWWLQTAIGATPKLWERNEADDGWNRLAYIGDTDDGSGNILSERYWKAQAAGTGNADAISEALSDDGEARAYHKAHATGDGNADTSPIAATDGSGTASSKTQATTTGTGKAEAGAESFASGDGDAETLFEATATGTGDAIAGFRVHGADDDILGLIATATPTGVKLVATGFPTADPEIAGEVWSNAGVLTISDGP